MSWNICRRFSTCRTYLSKANIVLPASVNWVAQGYVTRVKSQSSYNTCWAFSATGAIEGQRYKKFGKLESLSEQCLIDCAARHGYHFNKGGRAYQAFEIVIKNGGISTEKSYPYKGKKGKCKFNKKDIGTTLSGYKFIKPNEKALQHAVATIGPIAVVVDSNHKTFQRYTHGVYKEPRYIHHYLRDLDHAVLLVGYGVDKFEGEYWLIKNSWGNSWGINGYMKVQRNRNNCCGIASIAVYTII